MSAIHPIFKNRHKITASKSQNMGVRKKKCKKNAFFIRTSIKLLEMDEERREMDETSSDRWDNAKKEKACI